MTNKFNKLTIQENFDLTGALLLGADDTVKRIEENLAAVSKFTPQSEDQADSTHIGFLVYLSDQLLRTAKLLDNVYSSTQQAYLKEPKKKK